MTARPGMARAGGVFGTSRQGQRATIGDGRPLVVRKEECPGCLDTTDELGRMCIGFCGPLCRRRSARDYRLSLIDLLERSYE